MSNLGEVNMKNKQLTFKRVVFGVLIALVFAKASVNCIEALKIGVGDYLWRTKVTSQMLVNMLLTGHTKNKGNCIADYQLYELGDNNVLKLKHDYRNEIADSTGNVISITPRGSTRVYYNGNTYRLDKPGTEVSKEVGLSATQLITYILQSDDLVTEVKTDLNGARYRCATTHKIPTTDKALSECIQKNFPNFDNLQVRVYSSDKIQVYIGSTTVQYSDIGSGLNFCYLNLTRCKDTLPEGGTGFTLNPMWGGSGTANKDLLDLMTTEVTTLQPHLHLVAHNILSDYCKGVVGVPGNTWVNLNAQTKDSYISKLDCKGMLSALGIGTYYGINISELKECLKNQVDAYYQKFGTDYSLDDVVEYVVYTGGFIDELNKD